MDVLPNSGNELGEEQLTELHIKERKSLQAEITRLKHSASKGDKKKKKEIQVLIAQLEVELDEKQQKQLETLYSSKKIDNAANGLEKLTINNCEKDQNNDESVHDKKVSKAQRRRDKKTLKEKQREADITEQDKINLTGSRHLEIVKLKEILKERQLSIYEIPSDGNCLYAAVIHQLHGNILQDSVHDLRTQVANYMRNHKDDFIPFMCQKNSGDMFTEDDYESYCVEVETTTVWGGHHEILAISKILHKPIEILQAQSAVVKVGEEFTSPLLVLLYMRHMYGLGEHYNSVQALIEEEEEEQQT